MCIRLHEGEDLEMIIAVDIDDVLCHFVETFAKYHNRLYGTTIVKDNFKSYEFHDAIGISVDVLIPRLHDFFNSKDFLEIKPIDEAVEVIEEASNNGHEIHIITSRPSSMMLDHTHNWLNLHFPNVKLASVIFTRESLNGSIWSKADAAKKIKADIMIEDNIKYAETFIGSGIKTFLINQPWNQPNGLEEHFIRVDSWQEIRDHLI